MEQKAQIKRKRKQLAQADAEATGKVKTSSTDLERLHAPFPGFLQRRVSKMTTKGNSPSKSDIHGVHGSAATPNKKSMASKLSLRQHSTTDQTARTIDVGSSLSMLSFKRGSTGKLESHYDFEARAKREQDELKFMRAQFFSRFRKSGKNVTQSFDSQVVCRDEIQLGSIIVDEPTKEMESAGHTEDESNLMRFEEPIKAEEFKELLKD